MRFAANYIIYVQVFHRVIASKSNIGQLIYIASRNNTPFVFALRALAKRSADPRLLVNKRRATRTRKIAVCDLYYITLNHTFAQNYFDSLRKRQPQVAVVSSTDTKIDSVSSSSNMQWWSKYIWFQYHLDLFVLNCIERKVSKPFRNQMYAMHIILIKIKSPNLHTEISFFICY